MTRALSVCALLVMLARTSMAADQPAETVVRLTVTPAAAPRPALRYQLLPPMSDMNPGNPILGYLKCYSEENHFFFDKDMVAKRDKWHDMPLKDLPLKEMHDAGYRKGAGPCARADQAARLDTLDWQVLPAMRKEGIHLLVPDLQQMRLLAGALQVRLRLEIAEKRFDDAVLTIQTMLALSRHVAEHPTLIGELVGLAIANITFESLAEMLAQPGCPNLYWALVNLPSPLLDMRRGLQGDRMLIDIELRRIDEHEPMGEAEIRKAVKGLQDLMVGTDVKVSEWLDEKVKDQGLVGAAKKRLIDAGLAEERLKLFPAQQILLLDEKRTLEEDRDDAMKLAPLPLWQIEKLAAAKPEPRSKALLGMYPVFLKVRLAFARLEQRVALLQGVEALRLYAASHNGAFPAKLSDTDVPIPADPITGQAFIYKLENGIATLQGSAPRGMEKMAHYNFRFELKIAK